MVETSNQGISQEKIPEQTTKVMGMATWDRKGQSHRKERGTVGAL